MRAMRRALPLPYNIANRGCANKKIIHWVCRRKLWLSFRRNFNLYSAIPSCLPISAWSTACILCGCLKTSLILFRRAAPAVRSRAGSLKRALRAL